MQRLQATNIKLVYPSGICLQIPKQTKGVLNNDTNNYCCSDPVRANKDNNRIDEGLLNKKPWQYARAFVLLKYRDAYI